MTNTVFPENWKTNFFEIFSNWQPEHPSSPQKIVIFNFVVNLQGAYLIQTLHPDIDLTFYIFLNKTGLFSPKGTDKNPLEELCTEFEEDLLYQ